LTVTATTPAPAHAAAPLASRRVDVELARVVAIVMVITIHVAAGAIAMGLAAHSQSGTYLAAIALNAFSRPGAPVFLAIAGWALLKRRPVSDEDVWLGRRMIRLLVPLGLWGLLRWATSPEGPVKRPRWITVGPNGVDAPIDVKRPRCRDVVGP
jgi:uncharacterized membrane protein